MLLCNDCIVKGAIQINLNWIELNCQMHVKLTHADIELASLREAENTGSWDAHVNTVLRYTLKQTVQRTIYLFKPQPFDKCTKPSNDANHHIRDLLLYIIMRSLKIFSVHYDIWSQQAPDVYVTSGWRWTWRQTDVAFWLKMKIGLTSIFDVNLTLT